MQYFRDIEQSNNISHAVYSSVDIRESDFKISAVDHNAFPGGFNNITNYDILLNKASKAFKAYFDNTHGGGEIKKILIIPDNITRNKNYVDNVHALKLILENASFTVRIGAIMNEDRDKISSSEFVQKSLDDGTISTVDGFVPDIIMLNNDLTTGVPDELIHTKQLITPHYSYGWYNRSKYKILFTYNNLISYVMESILEYDPWLLTTTISLVQDVSFHQKLNLHKIAEKADELLEGIRNKYNEYGIHETPRLFIKPDNGTHGLGITTITKGQDIININKKTRSSIHKIKFGVLNSSVLIQEAVPTKHSIHHQGVTMPAEKIMYNVNNNIVATLIRYNSRKNRVNNLNSNGMKITVANNQEPSYIERLISIAASYASALSI